MAALFGHGNPFSTQVGQLIEKSTDGSLASENWGLFMEICDLINETDEGPKDAIKAIRKRLSQNVGKNYTAVLYTLTCLETCVKNCERRFHFQVAHKDFLHDLIKIIGPKNDPPQAVQEKVLSLIQTWADAFRGIPDLKEVDKVYQELKTKGIEFPMTDLDGMAPIYTPARSVVDSEQALNRNRGSCNRVPPTTQVMPTQESVAPSQDQFTKLNREMEVVKGNVRVMSEMITELTPTSVDPSDLDLLQELNRTCRQMQQRTVELITTVGNEEVTNELLRVNDELNNVFLRYERFERYRTGNTSDAKTPDTAYSSPPAQDSYLPPSYEQVVSSSVAQPPQPGVIQASSNPNEGNLIDLGESPNPLTAADVQSKLAGLRVSKDPPSYEPATRSDDFDMFAQSRQSFEENKQSMGGSGYNQHDEQISGTLGEAVNVKAQPDVLKLQDKETDYDEMEAYIRETNPNYSVTGETISSSEFDRFLNERAATANTVPSIPAETGGTPQRGGSRNNRQIQKDDDDNPLFAL